MVRRPSALEWSIPLLRCPVCRDSLEFDVDVDDDGILRHRLPATCDERYPVIGAIPRMLLGSHRATVWRAHPHWFDVTAERRRIGAVWSEEGTTEGQTARIVAAFDDEWRLFAVVDSAEERKGFAQYFDLVEPRMLSEDQIVLDAGCGAGRWAYQVSVRGPRVLAVDLGQSIEIAARNTSSAGRVACVQADLQALPLGAGSVDWAYSLGVLHHVEDPARALRLISSAVRSGGSVLLYLYYAFDNRGPAYRALFRVVDAIRRVTSRLPRALLVTFASATAVLVYWPLARAARVLDRVGAMRLAAAIPLGFYRDRSLRIMRNDSVDRFGTTLERRFSRVDFTRLAVASGLEEPALSQHPPYWHGLARVADGSRET